jgi:hypothetical protein
MEVAEARKNAINSVFWDAEKGQWLDYRLTNGTICKVLSSCLCFNSHYLIIIDFSVLLLIFVDFTLSGI